MNEKGLYNYQLLLFFNCEDLTPFFVVVFGEPQESGLLRKCIPIGEYRDKAYRVSRDLVERWGRLTIKGGYLQRSINIPRILKPDRFLKWFNKRNMGFDEPK